MSNAAQRPHPNERLDFVTAYRGHSLPSPFERIGITTTDGQRFLLKKAPTSIGSEAIQVRSQAGHARAGPFARLDGINDCTAEAGTNTCALGSLANDGVWEAVVVGRVANARRWRRRGSIWRCKTRRNISVWRPMYCGPRRSFWRPKTL